jgi:hypothetical protein
VGKRSNDSHNSKLVIEVIQGEGRWRKQLDDPNLLIYPVDE